jgi:hypothetical protein
MIKPFLTAGPQISVMLSCNYYDEDGDKDSCDDVFGEEDSYTMLDGGIVLGGGLTRDRWSLNVRYDLGLMNITKSDGWTSRHRALMILLGFEL